jgi:alpha 1,3-glucosidase
VCQIVLGKSIWADFADPKVRDWWASCFTNYSTMTYILHIWNDMNEPSVFDAAEITMPKDNLHLSGTVEHRDLHNLYGQYMHRATFEALQKIKKERPFVLSRAFFAGTQKFGAVWTGDNAADWNHLKVSVPMLLSLSLSGLPFVGADVGGFFGDPSSDLLLRWYQTGVFYPFFRAHAHIDTLRREPWLAPEPHFGLIKEAIRLRYQLLPYIYTLFYEASITGVPIIRPMFFEFPNEPKLTNVHDQLLLGNSLLHKPITCSECEAIDIVLPSSKIWFDFFTLEPMKDSSMKVGLESIPLFVAGGSILPLKMRKRRSSVPMQWDPFTLLIVLDKEGKAKGTVYADDGKSYDFEQGASLYRMLSFAGNILSCRPVDSIVYGLKQLPKSINTKIEAIVITGFNGSLPSQAAYNQKKLILENDTEAIVRVRNPPMSLFDSWDIMLS